MAAIQTMKRSDTQKEPAALIFSKAAGSKWAHGCVCCTTAFFSFAVVRQLVPFALILTSNPHRNVTDTRCFDRIMG